MYLYEYLIYHMTPASSLRMHQLSLPPKLTFEETVAKLKAADVDKNEVRTTHSENDFIVLLEKSKASQTNGTSIGDELEAVVAEV